MHFLRRLLKDYQIIVFVFSSSKRYTNQVFTKQLDFYINLLDSKYNFT